MRAKTLLTESQLEQVRASYQRGVSIASLMKDYRLGHRRVIGLLDGLYIPRDMKTRKAVRPKKPVVTEPTAIEPTTAAASALDPIAFVLAFEPGVAPGIREFNGIVTTLEQRVSTANAERDTAWIELQKLRITLNETNCASRAWQEQLSVISKPLSSIMRGGIMSERGLLLASIGALAGVGVMAGATAIHRWWRYR